MRRIVEGQSLTAQVSTTIREAILTGELEPATLYSVSQLAQDLDVSRTPVREALLKLADAGLVKVERNRGFRVVRRDAEHVAEVFELRLLLEVPATGQAARRVEPELLDALDAELDAMQAAAREGDERLFMQHDRTFHDTVLAAGGNRLLGTVVANLRDTIITLGASTVPRSRSLEDITAEHTPIRFALAAKDAVAASAAMRSHLVHTRDLLLAQFEAVPPPR